MLLIKLVGIKPILWKKQEKLLEILLTYKLIELWYGLIKLILIMEIKIMLFKFLMELLMFVLLDAKIVIALSAILPSFSSPIVGPVKPVLLAV